MGYEQFLYDHGLYLDAINVVKTENCITIVFSSPGWHRKLNTNCKKNMPFYLLLEILHQEAIDAEIDTDMVCDGNITERVHAPYIAENEKLFEYWKVFENGQMAPSLLLKKCAHIYSPSTV